MRRLARLPSFAAADAADPPAGTDDLSDGTAGQPADSAVAARTAPPTIPEHAEPPAAQPCATAGDQALPRDTDTPASPSAEGVPAFARAADGGMTASPAPDQHPTKPGPETREPCDTAAPMPVSALPDEALPELTQNTENGDSPGATDDGVGRDSSTLPAGLDGLAIAIDGFADRMEAYRASIGEAAAQAFGDAARRCLPRMADAAAAAEIAQSARALAASCQGGTIELRVPPALVRPLAEALDRRMPAMTCVIAGDPGLAPDRAEIAWRGERCWPDPEQLAGAATAILGDAIARQTTKGETG